ncbi:hypothetical protein DBR32_04800 [Taibaiella sp. KBW10]|uniref:hypothetical protein n=1 Tax=Taibaiella sp. KBW10 TaxID=2153357 RepID=UPI000F58F43D|nr:hypothetical protein [Taibaiella sp. KBW10]RQO31290.1 hypothetical protein DBR32_04800 [Taibaiella sp. KBW10]
MNWVYIVGLGILSLTACNKKKQSSEYFSFEANGQRYEYPQDETKGSLFVGSAYTLGAGNQSGSLGYQIYALSLKNQNATGMFQFSFSGNHMPLRDTLLLNDVSASIRIKDFIRQDDFYKMKANQTGSIIFTERTEQRLTGTFEFDVQLYHSDPAVLGGIIWSDTILHVTNGRFSIIPTN